MSRLCNSCSFKKLRVLSRYWLNGPSHALKHSFQIIVKRTILYRSFNMCMWVCPCMLKLLPFSLQEQSRKYRAVCRFVLTWEISSFYRLSLTHDVFAVCVRAPHQQGEVMMGPMALVCMNNDSCRSSSQETRGRATQSNTHSLGCSKKV